MEMQSGVQVRQEGPSAAALARAYRMLIEHAARREAAAEVQLKAAEIQPEAEAGQDAELEGGKH